MPGKPLVADVMLEGREGLRIRTVDDLVLLGEEPVPKLSDGLSGLLDYMTSIVCIRRSDISPLKICSKSIFKLFSASNGAFGEAFELVPSWPFEFEG